MTAPALVNASDVREYMEQSTTTGRWSDSQLGSNIRAATWVLERATGRFFADKAATLRFTTNGEAFIAIPGLRAVSSAPTLQGSSLVADSTYHLIPDSQQTGVYTGIQFRGFGTGTYGAGWWLGNPWWFDHNLDHPHYPANRGSGYSSLPNDLVVPGNWGYASGSVPEPPLFATKILAAFFTVRPDAVLSGARVTPDGNVVDLSQFPIEVQQFISEWRVGPWLSSIQ